MTKEEKAAYDKKYQKEYSKRRTEEQKQRKREYSREHYKKNKARILTRQHAYYEDEDNHKRKLSDSKKWRDNNKSKIKQHWRNSNFKKYGLTQEAYDLLLQRQDGKCKICGIHYNELERALDIDHDHITGEVRGLLCKNCNLMLGHAKDSPDLFISAIEYLSKKK